MGQHRQQESEQIDTVTTLVIGVKVERSDGTFENYGDCDVVVQKNILVIKPRERGQ